MNSSSTCTLTLPDCGLALTIAATGNQSLRIEPTDWTLKPGGAITITQDRGGNWRICDPGVALQRAPRKVAQWKLERSPRRGYARAVRKV
jgi:hypothetical protein